MKKQTGFISSSSSTSIVYSTRSSSSTEFTGYSNVYAGDTSATTTTWNVKTALGTSTNIQTTVWKTYASTSYQRIESFLNVVENAGSPYESSNTRNMPYLFYNSSVYAKNMYDGFVDVVVTFPCEIRLAGIELLNPWVDTLNSDDDWRYLPTRFNIYKVNNELVNDMLANVTYENDVVNKVTGNNNATTIRPVTYDRIKTDKKMIFLGSYDVQWKNLGSYKCFFKYNENDAVSVAMSNANYNTGTATWLCKQLVIRIFSTAIPKEDIETKLTRYMLNKEIEYGTTFNSKTPTMTAIAALRNALSEEHGEDAGEISSTRTDMQGWKFGSVIPRSYNDKSKLSFSTGIDYKLGGIQLLLSPDMFSVSEMKMYNYASKAISKVYIGEWNSTYKTVEYYGPGVIKTSPDLDIAEANSAAIAWKHNFNIPPKYLDAQVFVKFKIDYEGFYVGDVVSNLVNIDKEPITMKLTGSDVSINISRGICFTNPDTGEFMTFLNGISVQLDREGDYSLLEAAKTVGANVMSAGSKVSTKIEGGYPFDIYFVVKRLF